MSSKKLQKWQKEKDDQILYNKLKSIQHGSSEYNFRGEAGKNPQGEKSKKQNHYLVTHKLLEVQRENAILAKKIRETGNRPIQSSIPF